MKRFIFALLKTCQTVTLGLVAFALAPGLAHAAEAGPDKPEETYRRQLLLVLDPLQTSVTALQIVSNDPSDPEVSKILDVIGPNEGIRKVLIDDLSSEVTQKADRPALSVESLLSNYMVVTYETLDEAARAIQRLKQFALVLNVQPNVRYQSSQTYYLEKNPSYSSEGTYQWGTNGSSTMNLPGAWAKLLGFAQIGAVDRGIYWDGAPLSTLKDLAGNFRAHFSRAAKLGQEEITAGQFLALDNDFNEAGSFRGHGTHVSGLMAANPPPSQPIGMRGACPKCSLAMMRFHPDPDEDVGSQLIVELVRSGVQVINLSWGTPAYDPDSPRPPAYCITSPNDTTLICLALQFAYNRQVAVVAASGNNRAAIQFPANQSTTFAVGGLERNPSSGAEQFWVNGWLTGGGSCPQGGVGVSQTGSNCSDGANVSAGKYQFVAPAKNVLSTTYKGYDYHPDIHCGDLWDPYEEGQPGNSGYLAEGYGTCTGTSMAAPIVAGLIGLMRSANPLLSSVDINAVLKRRSSGGGSVIDSNLGWGIPIAPDAVTAALSGANVSNPNLFDTGIKNRTTPLFSLYSSQGRNHYYTSVPQGGSAAITGTIKPSPKYKLVTSNFSANCSLATSGSCNNKPVNLSPTPQVKKPDGTSAGSGVPLRIINTGAGAPANITTPAISYVYTGSSGTASSAMTWPNRPLLPDINRSSTFVAELASDYALTYQSIGNVIPGYSVYPGITTIVVNPKSFLSVYVSHVNPVAGGPDLIPLYRLSRRCGDFASDICDAPGAANYNPFHVSHVYTTDTTELGTLTAAPNNYKLDGIDGYVFPKSYANAPVAGAVYLCRLRDPVRDEMILFPGNGSGGKKCYPPFPSYAAGSYYSAMLGGTEWLGWVIPYDGGNPPPTVSLTAPTGGSSYSPGATITISASATDAGGGVKFYSNGALVASDNTSPYSKTFTAGQPGSYVLYANATDSQGAQTTSAPVTINVNCPNPTPVFANPGFEVPSVGAGNYDDNPAGSAWTWVPVWGGGQSGISGNGSAFTSGNPNAPAGAQVAFIQGNNYAIQDVCFQNAGTYHVRLLAAQRGTYNNGGLQLELWVDGGYVGVIALAGSAPIDKTYQQKDSPSFTVTAGYHQIQLQGSNPSGLDNSILFDQAQILSP